MFAKRKQVSNYLWHWVVLVILIQLNKVQPLNYIFIILVVLLRSVNRVAGSIYEAQRLDSTAPKKHPSGGEPLATLSDLTGPEIEPRLLAPIAMSLSLHEPTV